VSPADHPEDPDADPVDRRQTEIGPGSLWFLRAVTALAALIVLWFLVDAIRG
jgi:hypothetical protein